MVGLLLYVDRIIASSQHWEFSLMRLLFCLFTLSINLHANIIGEVFEDTVYGTQAEGVKIAGGRSQQAPDRRVYQVTFSTRSEAKTDIVVVSHESGRVGKIITTVESVEEGVLKAAYFCEGEVFMPTRASWGHGLVLENNPGPKYRDKPFNITLDQVADGKGYTLHIECPSFLGLATAEAVEERRIQLRQLRDEYFKKQQGELTAEGKD